MFVVPMGGAWGKRLAGLAQSGTRSHVPRNPYLTIENVPEDVLLSRDQNRPKIARAQELIRSVDHVSRLHASYVEEREERGEELRSRHRL